MRKPATIGLASSYSIFRAISCKIQVIQGDILIAEETKKIIDGLWVAYDRGTVTLKGIDHPVHVIPCSEPHELF